MATEREWGFWLGLVVSQAAFVYGVYAVDRGDELAGLLICGMVVFNWIIYGIKAFVRYLNSRELRRKYPELRK